MIIDRLGSKAKDLKTHRWCAKRLTKAPVTYVATSNHNDQLCKETFEMCLVPDPVGTKDTKRNSLESIESSKGTATVVSSSDGINNENKLEKSKRSI